MSELHAGRIEGHRVGGKVLRCGEDEVGLGVNEPPDDPRRAEPIHMRPWASHPAPPPERVQRNVPFARCASRPGMQPHLDRLLEPSDFLMSGRIKEIDLPNPLELSGESRQLLGAARRAAWRDLPVEPARNLSIPLGQGAVLLVAY